MEHLLREVSPSASLRLSFRQKTEKYEHKKEDSFMRKKTAEIEKETDKEELFREMFTPEIPVRKKEPHISPLKISKRKKYTPKH